MFDNSNVRVIWWCNDAKFYSERRSSSPSSPTSSMLELYVSMMETKTKCTHTHTNTKKKATNTKQIDDRLRVCVYSGVNHTTYNHTVKAKQPPFICWKHVWLYVCVCVCVCLCRFTIIIRTSEQHIYTHTYMNQIGVANCNIHYQHHYHQYVCVLSEPYQTTLYNTTNKQKNSVWTNGPNVNVDSVGAKWDRIENRVLESNMYKVWVCKIKYRVLV